MNSKILGLACIASLTATVGTAHALDGELQIGPNDLRAGGELLNKHYSHGQVIHDDVTAHGSFDARWFDVGTPVYNTAMSGDALRQALGLESPA